jgi:hypothetical protein
MEDKTKLKEYISRRRKATAVKPVEVKEVKLAWYQRPIMREDFVTKKGRDNKLYIHHNEWSETIFVGPYNNTHEVTDIINSYIVASLEAPLDRKLDSRIHSIKIENPKEFFNGE